MTNKNQKQDIESRRLEVLGTMFLERHGYDAWGNRYPDRDKYLSHSRPLSRENIRAKTRGTGVFEYG